MVSTDRFDGLEVDRQQARLSGTVDIDPSDVERMSIDSEVLVVAVCRVGGAALDENQAGDLVRTNKLKIQRFALVRDAGLLEQLYDALPQLDGGGLQIPFHDPDPYAAPADANGEVNPDFVALNGTSVAAEFSVRPRETTEEVEEEEVFSPSEGEIFSPGGAPDGPTVRSAVPPEQPRRKPGEADPALAAFFDEPVNV